MPRKPKVIEVELAQLPPAPTRIQVPIEKSATEERRERELEEVLEGLAGDGRIMIYHVLDGKATYAGQMSLDAFSVDLLLDTYGGGDKSLVFFQGNTKKDTVRLALDPLIPPTSPRAKSLAARTAPAGPGQAFDMTGAMANMMTMQTQASTNMLTMMAGIMGAVTTALTTRPAGKDPTEMMIEMAKLFKPDAATTPAAEYFSIFEKGMNVAAKLGGGDDDGTLGVIKEGLGVVGKIVEQNGRQQAVSRVQAPAQITAGGASVLPANVQVGVDGMPVVVGRGDGAETIQSVASIPEQATMNYRPWVTAARPHMGMLIAMAGKFQPETAANMIGDALDESAFNDLLEDIESSDRAAFVARVGQYFAVTFAPSHADWFSRVADAVLTMVGDDEPETAP